MKVFNYTGRKKQKSFEEGASLRGRRKSYITYLKRLGRKAYVKKNLKQDT